MVWIALVIVTIAYLLGAIPTGYLVGKMLRGIDIREFGSKSSGATNVLRTLGKGPAFFVLVVDVLKGGAAIIFATRSYSWISAQPSFASPRGMDAGYFLPWFACLAGLAVLFGHSRSVWLRFRGGKSAATGLGVLLAIAPPVGLGVAAVWVLTLAAFRFVSLSSMLAALTAIVLALGFEHPTPYRLLILIGGLYVVVRHQANIKRLIVGTEPRIGQRK